MNDDSRLSLTGTGTFGDGSGDVMNNGSFIGIYRTMTVPNDLTGSGGDFAVWQGHTATLTGTHTFPGTYTVNENSSPEILELSGEEYLSLTAVVRDDDADLTVGAEASTDLSTWALSVVEVPGVDQDGVPTGFVRKTWRLADSLSDESTAFIRLSVELAE